MARPDGFPIVLTADRTLMADYRLLFDGMLAASQTTTFPPELLGALLMPRFRRPGERAKVAPLGLRRIEAALRDGGFSADEVAVVTEEQLDQAIGSATRVVGIGSGEPAGLGMNSSTMIAVAGGQIFPEAMFHRLLGRVRARVAAAAPQAKIVLGGAGAWQLAANPATQRKLGIDHVVTGYAEANAAAIFRSVMGGEASTTVLPGAGVPPEAVPRIRGASTMGVVEISRGCGLGCGFCTIARVPMMHLPEETIVADARTNVAAGVTSIAALSEDFFRYGASGLTVNPQALISLLRRLREIEGLRLIQIDHANVISIAQYSDQELRLVHELLVGSNRHDYLWVNVGVETASGALVKANGGGAKMGRHAADEWADLCLAQLRRLCAVGFFPMVSLVVGLPGETEEDVRRTLALVHTLQGERISVFPVLYAPVHGGPGVTVRDLRPWHWELIRTSYNFNFRWIPHMYWDNQVGAGVPIGKRLLLQVLGQGQAALWRALFAWHAGRAH